jgi:nucleoside phosphorylase/tetratricopeptide (TPR) repeat protein
MPTMASPAFDDYTVAWICALPLEATAARTMLDKTHAPPPRIADPNAYDFGELNGHHIVIAYLPNGVYGTVSAATVTSRMRLTFPRLQLGLMVGIGGGVPSESHDIRLGDVVVSKPGKKHGGVIQYDYGQAVQGGQFEQTGVLNQPPQALLTHMTWLESKHITGAEDAILQLVSVVLERDPSIREGFSAPEQHTDLFFHSSYRHVDKKQDCESCDKEQLVNRQPRDTKAPFIHYGLIASGNQVMKDSETRDRLAQQYGILCFEMEAAGLANELPTIVIRGICDYCDSHKHRKWQGYAALTAAAYVRLMLLTIPACLTDYNLLKTQGVRHWVMSLPRNPNFVGRQVEITKLEGLLTVQYGPRRVAITGLGGVGKTQVALEVAYRIRTQDKGCSVFWVPCTSHAMVEQAYLNIAQTLGLVDVEPGEVKEQVKIYLSSQRAARWLLVFDNADDTEMWLEANNITPALEDYLPQSEQGLILFTTRNQKLAMKLAPFNIIRIPDLDKDAALQVLRKMLANENLLKDNITAATLLEHLAFLPLAITQAAAYITENSIHLSDYLTLLQEQEQDVVDLLSEDFRDPGRYKDILNPVITTWLLSFKQIQHQNPLAADYLAFMACINPRNIPRSLLPLQTTTKQRLDALGVLNAYSFTNSQSTGVNMHRLVHIATRNWLRNNRMFGYWLQRVADRMQQVFPDNNHTNRRLWREYLPHALALVHDDEFIEQQKEHISLIRNIADCLASDGRYFESEVLYNKLLEMDQRTHGAEHPSTLTNMANLASTYRYQGRWNEAEKLEVQVMEVSKILLGAKHPNTLTSMANLASTYRNQGRWNEAEKLEVQVMEMSKIVLGAKHPDTLTSMANLASTYRNQGRWNEAEKLEVPVMEMSKTVLGAKHPDTLTSMANLASTYRNQGRWDEAKKLQVQVMEMAKIVLGAKHPCTLTSMANLAGIYWNQAQWKEAEKLEVQVMEIRKTVLGAEHPDTLSSMVNLAYTWKSQGRVLEALALLEESCRLRRKFLGPDHPSTTNAVNALSHWQGEHDSILNERHSPSPSRTEQSKLLQQILPQHTTAPIVTQSHHLGHITLPQTQGRLA